MDDPLKVGGMTSNDPPHSRFLFHLLCPAADRLFVLHLCQTPPPEWASLSVQLRFGGRRTLWQAGIGVWGVWRCQRRRQGFP